MGEAPGIEEKVAFRQGLYRRVEPPQWEAVLACRKGHLCAIAAKGPLAPCERDVADRLNRNGTA